MPGPESFLADPDVGPERSTEPATAATTPYGLVCLRDETDDGTLRFTLSGELDFATVPELDRALRTAQRHAQSVTVDLRRLSFMDCRGLAAIIAAAKRANANRGSFRVVRGPPHVHRLFTLTETDRQIKIADASIALPDGSDGLPGECGISPR